MISSSVTGGVQPNPRKRHRSAPSCQECRRRKVKCDRSEPCGHCVISKKQCHYDHGLAQASRNLNRRGPVGQGVLGHAPVEQVRVPYATPPQASVSATGPSPASDTSRLKEQAPKVQVTAQTSRDIVRSPNFGANTNAVLDNLETGPRNVEIILNKSRLFGQSHWTNSTLEVCCEQDYLNISRPSGLKLDSTKKQRLY